MILGGVGAERKRAQGEGGDEDEEHESSSFSKRSQVSEIHDSGISNALCTMIE